MLSKVLIAFGEHSDFEIRQMVDQFLQPSGMTLTDAANAGILRDIKFVHLRWLTSRRIAGNDTNHQSAGLDPLDQELSTLSRMSEDEKLTHPPLLPPSHQQTMPGDPSTGIQAGMQSKDDRS